MTFQRASERSMLESAKEHRMRSYSWLVAVGFFAVIAMVPSMARAQDDSGGGGAGGSAMPPTTPAAAAGVKVSRKQSTVFGPQEPAKMQVVFRTPPRRRTKPVVFDYYRHCGFYSQVEHRASICVLESGRIFGGIPKNIDENDKVTVYLIVRRWLGKYYKVQMKPQARFQRGPAGVVIPAHEAVPDKKPIFVIKKFNFGPFRPGKVVFSVSRPSIGRPGLGLVDVTHILHIGGLSQFSLAVGMIGIYPINPTYKLIQERGSSITRIVKSDEGPIALDLILIAKLYSWQFWDRKIFAGRDLRKPPLFLQRINLDIGLSFKDILKSYYVGLGFEVSSGFDIVAGVNLRVVEVLAGGYQEGNPFAGDVSELPTVTRFRVVFYAGLSISPEVFVSIFKTISSGRLFGR